MFQSRLDIFSQSQWVNMVRHPLMKAYSFVLSYKMLHSLSAYFIFLCSCWRELWSVFVPRNNDLEKNHDLMISMFIFFSRYDEKWKRGKWERGGRLRSLSEQQGDFKFSSSWYEMTAAKLMKFTAVFTIAYQFMEVIDKNNNIKFNGQLAILMTHFPRWETEISSVLHVRLFKECHK